MTVRNEKGQFVTGQGINDLTGQRFGMLEVIEISERRVGRKTYWVCKCDCGTLKEIRSDVLTNKREPKTVSCGCWKKKVVTKHVVKNHKHKGSRTRLYHIWQNMKARCYNKKDTSYSRYGGRGIKVCDEWFNDFAAFKAWAGENGYENHLSIERIDVNDNYEPNNCTWIEVEDQANNRRPTIWIEHNGERLNLKQWSKKLNINYGTILSRHHRGKRTPEELFALVKQR